MKRRFMLAALLVAALTALGMGSAMAVPVLSVDFGRVLAAPTPVQPGFTGIAGNASEPSHTEAAGAFNVTVEGNGFFNAGFNAGNVDPAVAPLFEDYYYNNATDPAVGIRVAITGVTPNQDYDVTVWSYDEDNIFSVTPTQWGPASGSATTGTTGLVSDSGATPYPTSLAEKSTTIRLRSTTNELAFFGASTGGSGGTRLNGFQLSPVPEPASLMLAGAGAMAMAAVRRRAEHRP
jgi:hypothetical protein